MADPVAVKLERLESRALGPGRVPGGALRATEELLAFAREINEAHKYVAGEDAWDVDRKVGLALQKLADA